MKKSIARAFVAFAFLRSACWAIGEGAFALPEEQLPPLQGVVEQALLQSPRLLERNLDLLQAEADGFVARSSSLPRAGGNLQYRFQNEKRGAGASRKNVEKFYYNASVDQSVWHWGSLEAARKISRIDESLARLNYAEAYRMLAIEVRSAYMGLILQQIALRNSEHVLQMARANLERQQERYKTGQITYGQIMVDQLRLDDAELAARRSRVEMEFSVEAFRTLTGVTGFSAADIPTSVPELLRAPVEQSAVAASAPESHPSLIAAEKEVEKAKLGLIGPRYNLYPKFDLTAGISRDEIADDQDRNQRYLTDELFVGLSIHWNIFDGFSTKGQKLAANTRLRRAEQRLAAAREALDRSTAREENEIRFTWDAYQIAKMRLRMAREGLAHTEEQSKQGLASQAQIDDAQTNVNNHLYSAQAALVAHLTANVHFLSSRGGDPLGKSAVHY